MPSPESDPPAAERLLDAADRRRLAASFERGADGYERARPSFPDAALDFVLPPGVRRVLDLGAGTGRLTASLVARGLDVVALDPSPAMLAHLRRRLPAVDARPGTAEDTGLPDADVDAVVVGSAFHWFDRPAADGEIARVLRPGGRVGLLWNRRDHRDGVSRAFDEVPLPAHIPRQRDRDRSATTLDPHRFGPTERADVPHEQTTTPEGLVELIGSRSYVLDLPDDERVRTLDDVRGFLATDPRTAGRTRLSLRYLTLCLRADKLC